MKTRKISRQSENERLANLFVKFICISAICMKTNNKKNYTKNMFLSTKNAR